MLSLSPIQSDWWGWYDLFGGYLWLGFALLVLFVAGRAALRSAPPQGEAALADRPAALDDAAAARRRGARGARMTLLLGGLLLLLAAAFGFLASGKVGPAGVAPGLGGIACIGAAFLVRNPAKA